MCQHKENELTLDVQKQNMIKTKKMFLLYFAMTLTDK